MSKRKKSKCSARTPPDERDDGRWARVIETIDDLRQYYPDLHHKKD